MCLRVVLVIFRKYWVEIPYNIISLPNNFFGNILGKRVEVLSFLIEFDNTGFKKTLWREQAIQEHSNRGLENITIGARMISS
jgi:hypothetical protein